MILYLMVVLLMPGLVPEICEASSKHFIKKKDISRGLFSKNMNHNSEKRNLAFLKSTKVPMSDSAVDVPLERGSFKIDDGKVIGGGTYDIGKDGVNIDLKIKIAPDYEEGKPQTTTPPGAPQVTAQPSTGSDIEEEALDLHNKFRAVHDAPPMTLNAEMSQSAASYAQTLANLGTLQHASKDERGGNGENLSFGCSSSKGQTATEAVTNWYNEICDPGYSFGSESMGGAGHFTQLVWKESVELGFGKADSEQNGMKCTYYVARYKKAGNMIGDFAANVVKGSFDQMSYCSTIKKSKLNTLH